MKISGEWLTNAGTQKVFERLTAAGHQAFAVGGCVRNALLGAPVADIDIATSATPQDTIAACKGLRVVPTGIDHGTVTVISGDHAHEVTTFRQDVETDGRHARVVFGTDITADAARRDFTMNALYCAADGSVTDPLGGLPDLHAARLRFIGDPNARITEDYLRILRFFRFTAWYGDSLDAEGLAACAAHAEGLQQISRERIGQEMRKLLAAPDPAPAVAAMAQSGVLMHVLPAADPRALAPLVHLETAPDWRTRMASLGGDISTLRLSKAQAKHIATLRTAATGTDSPFALGHLHGTETALQVATLRAALLEQPPQTDGITDGAAATFPLKAKDLSALKGPQLGAALTAARAHWLSNRGAPDARALLEWLDTQSF